MNENNTPEIAVLKAVQENLSQRLARLEERTVNRARYMADLAHQRESLGKLSDLICSLQKNILELRAENGPWRGRASKIMDDE